MRAVVNDKSGCRFVTDHQPNPPIGEIPVPTTSDRVGPPLAPIVIDEITVVGSRCGPFPAALQALQHGEIEVSSLITARYALEDAEEALRAAASPAQRKIVLDVA